MKKSYISIFVLITLTLGVIGFVVYTNSQSAGVNINEQKELTFDEAETVAYNDYTALPKTLYKESRAKDCGEIIYGHVNPTSESSNKAVRNCLLKSFDSCKKAKSLTGGVAEEGGEIKYFFEIQGKEGGKCKIFNHKGSNDNFGERGNFEKTCYRINREYPFLSCL